MDDFQITDSVIYNYINNPGVYQRGNLYNLNNRIYNFEYDRETKTINANVFGTEEYDVNISFNNNGNIASSHCTCSTFYNHGQACKHIAAVLKYAQKALLRIHRAPIHNRNAVNQIFSYFSSIYENHEKEQIQLEIIFNHDREFGIPTSSVELKIGAGRLYIVKSIKEFIASLDAQQSIEFGKNFTFEPSIHTFTPSSFEVLALIKEMYENELLLKNSIATYHQTGSFFKGKKLYLSDSGIHRLFRLLSNTPFHAYILGNEIDNIRIVNKDLPLEFLLKSNNQDMALVLNHKELMLPLTSNGCYYYYKGAIYHPSEQQQKYLPVFIHSFNTSASKQILFKSTEKERFVSEVLPFVQQIAAIEIEEAIEQSLCKEDLQARIYFDKHLEGISARIEFVYGTEVINPFAPSQSNNNFNNKILIRDPFKERAILKVFEDADFKVEKDIIYLPEEDHVFEFIYGTLPVLQEQADVFYSDAFKSMRVRENWTFSGGIRLNESTNMLEFSFHIENIDNSELEHIFASLRMKKKYYRLKDGTFIPLDIPQLGTMAELIEQLDLSAGSLSEKVVNLPAYRAAFIDTLIREGDLHSIERNPAFKQMVLNIREPQDMEFSIPEELQHTLRDYQKIGYKWLKTLSHYGLGGILADDMGLGKTLQVIAFILSEKSKNQGPALVIAPSSLVFNWRDEVNKFVPGLKVAIISGMQKERQDQLSEITNADLVVTSYPLIRRDIDLYEEMTFSYCFLDEAQHIKNPNTSNARSVKQIKARGYFALTGTPIENSLTELWSIFDFIMPGYLLSHTKFMQKFETPIVRNGSEKALKDLGMHITPFILRRMKKDVLKELPDKIESNITAEMSDEQKKVYLAYLQQAKGEIAMELKEHGYDKSHIKILSVLTRLRQICCHPSLFIENYEGESGKMALLEELLEDAINGGHRVLIFSQFTSMLDIIQKSLEDNHIEYFYLQGSTKLEERGKMVKMFNQGSGKVFLISLKAGGTGLNLTGADTVIHFDPWWNPAVEDQATDRAYRIGQKNIVQVFKLITQGTIEEKIFELQQKKKTMIDAVIQPGETFLSKMTKEEILGLFDL